MELGVDRRQQPIAGGADSPAPQASSIWVTLDESGSAARDATIGDEVGGVKKDAGESPDRSRAGPVRHSASEWADHPDHRDSSRGHRHVALACGHPYSAATPTAGKEYVAFGNMESRNGTSGACGDSLLVRALGLARGERILEVGCGRGVALPVFAERLAPRELVGIDIDPS